MRVVRVSETLDEREPADRLLEAPEAVPEDPGETLPLVLVRWHDAWFDPEQLSPEDWRGDYLVHTVGFLVRQDAHLVSVAQELLPDGDGFRAVTHIPVSTIESITALHRDGQPARLATGG